MQQQQQQRTALGFNAENFALENRTKSQLKGDNTALQTECEKELTFHFSQQQDKQEIFGLC